MLNLDNDQSTNFAVYKDDTLVISKSTYNVLKSADEESGKYVFTNCNEELKSLASGDVFSYKYDSGKTLIVKVKDISVSGSTVTVTDDGNAELADIFDYVKIEASESVAKIDPSSASDGVTVETGESSVSSSDDDKSVESVGVSYEGGMSDTLSVTVDLDKPLIGSIEVSLSTSVGVDIYINNKVWEYKTHYIDFSIEYGASVTFSAEAEVSKPISKVLATMRFTPVAGVNVELKPKLNFSVSASISVGASVEGKFGFNASFAHGVQNTSKAPEFSLPKFNFEGEIFLGFDLNPSLNIVTSRLAEASLDMTLGATISASPTEDDEDDHRVHRCTLCLSGTIAPTFSIEVSADLIGKSVGSYNKTFEIVKIPFYFSVNHLEFGLGECPYFTSYKCGDKAKWRLDNDGTMVIYGKGKMYDFDKENAPWLDFRDEIKKVVIEDGITSIGDCAFCFGSFYCCGNLKEVTIPNSVTRIGKYALSSSGITSITIPDSITEIGVGAFEKCYYLKRITIPDSVTKIGDFAFAYSGLTSIKISDNVTDIAEGTFRGCYYLKTVKIPDKVTKIGREGFAGCKVLSSVTIPDSVTYIDWHAFYNCDELASIKLPNNLTYIGEQAFYSCEKLQEVNIPDKVKIGNGSFMYCTSLKSITIPDSVTEIGGHAFNQSGITSITIPSGVSELKDWTFAGCSALKEIYFKGDCPKIGQGTFNGVTATLYYPAGNKTYKDFDPNSDNCKIKLAPYDYSSSVAPQSTALKANTSVKANTSTEPKIEYVDAKYTNKIADFEYIISVVKDEKAEDVLSSANLIYMTQVKADKNGNISVSLPISSDVTDYKVMIFGPEKGDMYKDGGIDVLDVTKLQQYLAGDNDISYIPVEVADIDNDGKVTVNDVTRLQMYLAKMISTLS